MQSSESFLRQLSGKEAWKSTSNRWGGKRRFSSSEGRKFGEDDGFHIYGNDNAGMAVKKRVMVVVDQTEHSKHAMMWALTHVVNKGDVLTLLVIVHPHACSESSSSSTYLANYLGTICKESNPEVEVEALVIQGPKLATVMSQVKKLEVSLLVLGQKKSSAFINCLCGTSSSEDFVEQCINNAECMTIGVRKRSQGTSGYLISTRRHKNFWLLA